MGSRLKLLIGAVVGVVVLAIGGAWIYAAIDEAPDELELSSDDDATTTSTQTGSGTTVGNASAGIDGTWNATSKSVVGYRVKETLAGAANTAYGRTSDVTGTMTVAGTRVNTVQLTVDMASISSDRTQRDGQFRSRIMETSTYPTATFKLSSPIDLGAVPAVGADVTRKAVGQLMLHGVTKDVTFDVKAQRKSDGTIEVNGQIPVEFDEYNISDPSGGPAQTEDNGILEFLVVFAR